MENRTPRLFGALLAGLAFMAAAAGSAAAQPAEPVRIYEEQLRLELDQQRPWSREHTFDVGGWFNFAFLSYDDAGAGRTRKLLQYQLRPWASMNLQGVHQAYFRALLGWNDWDVGDNPNDWIDGDFEDRIERAWYRFDLGQLLSNRAGRPLGWGFSVKAGRQYVTFGTALALAMPLDAVRFDGAWRDLEFTGFLGMTVNDDRNIDPSPAVPEQDRCLWGVQLTYRGLTYHRPFAYFFANNDHTQPDRSVLPTTQNYDYTTRYVGVGSSGSLLVPELTYSTELVGEWGKTFSRNQHAGQDDVCALAYDLQLEYLFDVATRPRVNFEYIFASGDGDRGLSSVMTFGGNRPGTTDHAFNAFGFRDTGVALAPRLSNLHLFRTGAKFLPFEDILYLERLELGTNVYFYAKHKSAGPISDTTAFQDDHWLGWEWDVFLNWRVTNDLSLTSRYGVFVPGEAYSKNYNDLRNFFYAGLSLSF